MIVGIGTDIIKIERMQTLFERHGKAFVQRIFTEDERIEAAGRSNPIEYYAGRWAAKEAVSKALGCGIGKDCVWQDINIRSTPQGNPEFTLTGRAAAKAALLQARHFHISIAHEREYACAMIILES
ncbi:MAG: holo-ACP synthase [Victivallaceae bacterium]|nr:holo-ACP synthase [Victivallaceae bacterium]